METHFKQKIHLWIPQLVKVTPINRPVRPNMRFYKERCRSLHLWPPVVQLCDDDRNPLIETQRQSKRAVSPALWALCFAEVSENEGGHKP